MLPMLCDGVVLGEYTYEELPEETHYYADNIDGKRFELSYDELNELLKADGTQKLNFSEKELRRYKRRKILTTSRYSFKWFDSTFLLFIIPESIKKYQPICKKINTLLPIITPILLICTCCLWKKHTEYVGEINIGVYYLLIMLAMIFHELAHLNAGIAYGYRCTGLGLLLAVFFPVGAYLSNYGNDDALPIERCQFSLAGIEVNLCLAGIFMMISFVQSGLDWTFFGAALGSLLLAILNTLPALSLDGEHALSALLGFSVAEKTERFIKSKRYRRKILRSPKARKLRTVIIICIISTIAVGTVILCDVAFLFKWLLS